MITSVEAVNDKQKLVIADKVVHRFGENLSGKTFAIWGLAFKPGTDDMREAPAIYVVKELVKRGAQLRPMIQKPCMKRNHFILKERQTLVITILNMKL